MFAGMRNPGSAEGETSAFVERSRTSLPRQTSGPTVLPRVKPRPSLSGASRQAGKAVICAVLPRVKPRPSLSVPELEARDQRRVVVLPRVKPRPSLSAAHKHRRPSPAPWGSAEGETSAFVERGKRHRRRWRLPQGSAEGETSAFVERPRVARVGIFANALVLPRVKPRPSLSGSAAEPSTHGLSRGSAEGETAAVVERVTAGAHIGSQSKKVLPRVKPRPSLSVCWITAGSSESDAVLPRVKPRPSLSGRVSRGRQRR